LEVVDEVVLVGADLLAWFERAGARLALGSQVLEIDAARKQNHPGRIGVFFVCQAKS
jgi:hypothetical protein